MIARLWAEKILCGEREYSEVPILLREQVGRILTEAGAAEVEVFMRKRG